MHKNLLQTIQQSVRVKLFTRSSGWLKMAAAAPTPEAEAETSSMAAITNAPADPLELFRHLLQLQNSSFTTMNLATIDDEFGVLNRTVAYRGIVDDAVVYVTERKTRNYHNLKKNPRLCVTFFFPDLAEQSGGAQQNWQVRLLDAEAVELRDDQIATLWPEEELMAKIRSYICECGKPVDHAELQRQHDALLLQYKSGQHQLQQTTTYTAMKFIPKRWDFYKSEKNKIADRLQYRRKDGTENQWEILHVAA